MKPIPLSASAQQAKMFHVKHHTRILTPAWVTAGAAEVGVSITAWQAQQLVRHAHLVLEWNSSRNLTRIVDPDDVCVLHVVDSLAFLPHFPQLRGRMIDLGSGAGYPGIPLAILGHDVTLCESVQKKAAFLEHAVVALGLQTWVFAGRAEDLARTQPGTFDVVVARAVSSLASLTELAAPLLREGGHLVALKGVPDAAEYERGRAAGASVGMQEIARKRYVLQRGEERTAVQYLRQGPVQVRLPRRAGMAQRHPLGAAAP